MNIVIFTGRFGMGHYSVAYALKEEIEASFIDVTVIIIDIIDYLLPHISKLIYSSFDIMVTQFSCLYNFLNKITEKHNSIPCQKFIVKKLSDVYEQHKPGIVISTLPLSSQYVSIYNKVRHCDIPLLTFITDAYAHEEWITTQTAYYFVGMESVRNELINHGISEKQIIISGIPVRQSFKHIIPHHNLGQYKKEILIMGGGLGLIPNSKKLLTALNANSSIKTTVITGSNTKLYHSLQKKYKNMNIIGYTDKVHDYMSRADILISKAGGITLFEALYCETPIYVIHPFLQQEKSNAKYIEQQHIGRIIWDKHTDVYADLIALLNNEQALAAMHSNLGYFKTHPTGQYAMKNIIAAHMGA